MLATRFLSSLEEPNFSILKMEDCYENFRLTKSLRNILVLFAILSVARLYSVQGQGDMRKMKRKVHVRKLHGINAVLSRDLVRESEKPTKTLSHTIQWGCTAILVLPICYRRFERTCCLSLELNSFSSTFRRNLLL